MPPRKAFKLRVVDHPETRDGEVFLYNTLPEYFEVIVWETKRLGEKALGPDGEHIKNRVPVFAKKAEIVNAGISLI